MKLLEKNRQYRRFQAPFGSRSILLIFASLVLATASSWADEIAYSNFGPNDQIGGGGAPIGIGKWPQDSSNNQHWAVHFTAQASGTVSSVEVGISLSNAGDDDIMEVQLWSGGRVPGESIWSGLILPVFSAEPYEVVTNGELAELVAGEDYWISARSFNGTGRYIWYGNPVSATDNYVFDTSGGTGWSNPLSFNQQSFRIQVGSVPEPTGIPVVLLSYMIHSWRRKRV